MIDRMFIQEEKTMLALDKQLAKEKPGGQRSPLPLRLRGTKHTSCMCCTTACLQAVLSRGPTGLRAGQLPAPSVCPSVPSPSRGCSCQSVPPRGCGLKL